MELQNSLEVRIQNIKNELIKKNEFLFLTQDNVINCGLLDLRNGLKIIEEALIWHNNNISSSTKAVLELDPKNEWKFNSLIAVNGNYSANKWVGSNSNNKKHNSPRSLSTIILNDKNTGKTLSIINGNLISALRTGFYSALGLKYLSQDINNIGIIGSGVMAKTSLLAMSLMYDKIKNVFVYSKNPNHYNQFAKLMTYKTGLSITPIDNPSELVRYSDITVSAITKNDEIIVKKKDVKPGSTHIHIGGWDDDENYIVDCGRKGKIICDDWELIKKRNAHPLPLAYNKGIIQDKDIYGEIGDVICGTIPGREENENIYFDTVGIPEMDMIYAINIFENALKNNIGTKLSFNGQLFEHWILKGYEN